MQIMPFIFANMKGFQANSDTVFREQPAAMDTVVVLVNFLLFATLLLQFVQVCLHLFILMMGQLSCSSEVMAERNCSFSAMEKRFRGLSSRQNTRS